MQKRVMQTMALMLGLATASTAQAQMMGASRAVSFGIAAGATIPVGDAADALATGFNVMGILDVQPVAMPLGVRFDVAYHSLGFKDDLGIVSDPGNFRIWSGTANAKLTASNNGVVRTYVLGGVGVYATSCDGCESQTKFGLNGGGGIEFGVGGFNAFTEARFHSIFVKNDGSTSGGNINFVPIVFGIRF